MTGAVPFVYAEVSAQRDVPGGVGVEIEVGPLAGQILVISLTADHGAVVAAVLQLGEIELHRQTVQLRPFPAGKAPWFRYADQ